MNFAKLFHKSNSSIHQLQGNVLECTIEQIRGNKVIVDTGMRASFVCFRDELSESSTMIDEAPGALRRKVVRKQLRRQRRFAYHRRFDQKATEPKRSSSFARLRLPNSPLGPLGEKLKGRASLAKAPRPGARPAGDPPLSYAYAALSEPGRAMLRASPPRHKGHPAPPTGVPKGALRDFGAAETGLRRREPGLTQKSGAAALFDAGFNDAGRVWSFIPFLAQKPTHPLEIEVWRLERREAPAVYGSTDGVWPSTRATDLTPEDREAVYFGGSPKIGRRLCVRRQRKRAFGPSIIDSGAFRAHLKSGKKTQFVSAAKSVGVLSSMVEPDSPSGPSHPRSRKRSSKIFAQQTSSRFPGLSALPLTAPPAAKAQLRSPTQGACVIGVEEKRSPLTGEFTCSAPKSMEKISKRKLVWTELSKLWRTNVRMKGFILNSVNGGYAVAIAGYIAFLPKSLCINKKVFIGQWRQFAIIGMNPKIANIVVKEIRTAPGGRFISKARAQRTRRIKDRNSIRLRPAREPGRRSE